MNNWLIVTFLILAQPAIDVLIQAQESNGTQPSTGGGGEIDDELYENYKKEVCERVPAFTGGTEPAPDFDSVMSESEVLELSFVNMAYGLTADSISHLKPELGWKKTVIDLISLITKTTCKDDVISETYLNAAKNLYLYYLSKRPMSATANATNGTEDRASEWQEIIQSLKTCSGAINPIEISTQCGVATTYDSKDGGSQPIVETVERLDEEASEGADLGIDIIIDAVWWMFSTAYSRCYAYFYPNEDIILLFFQMFREDFLEQFLQRWRGAGSNTAHFPIIFGPYDFKASSENVRKCASAAYQYEGLTERQLVRPVTVMVDNAAVRNFKVVKG